MSRRVLLLIDLWGCVFPEGNRCRRQAQGDPWRTSACKSFTRVNALG
jgi:hypothetical protein